MNGESKPLLQGGGILTRERPDDLPVAHRTGGMRGTGGVNILRGCRVPDQQAMSFT